MYGDRAQENEFPETIRLIRSLAGKGYEELKLPPDRDVTEKESYPKDVLVKLILSFPAIPWKVQQGVDRDTVYGWGFVGHQDDDVVQDAGKRV